MQPKRGKAQDATGGYPGSIRSLNAADLRRHIKGEITLAFAAARNRRTRFACIDDDTGFPSRLPIYEAVLSDLGLDRAAFATPGSSPQRMKIVVVFSADTPQHQAKAVVESIITKASQHPGFGTVDVQHYPTAGEGGIVRILGRNLGRNGAIEFPLDLAGHRTDLTYLRPAKPTELAAVVPLQPLAPAPRPTKHTQKVLTAPITSEMGHDVRFKKVVYLAREAYRLHGDLGFDQFVGYAATLAQRSDDPNLPCITNKRLLSRLRDSHWLKLIWEWVVAHPSSWCPLTFGGLPPDTVLLALRARRGRVVVPCHTSAEPTALHVHPNGVLAYDGLLAIAIERGLHQHCVNPDLRTLGDRIGVAEATTVRRFVRYAEQARILVVLDRGWSDRPGTKGVPAIY